MSLEYLYDLGFNGEIETIYFSGEISESQTIIDARYFLF